MRLMLLYWHASSINNAFDQLIQINLIDGRGHICYRIPYMGRGSALVPLPDDLGNSIDGWWTDHMLDALLGWMHWVCNWPTVWDTWNSMKYMDLVIKYMTLSQNTWILNEIHQYFTRYRIWMGKGQGYNGSIGSQNLCGGYLKFSYILSQSSSSGSSSSSSLRSGGIVTALISLSCTYPIKLHAPRHIKACVNWIKRQLQRCDSRIRPLLNTHSTLTEVATEDVSIKTQHLT